MHSRHESFPRNVEQMKEKRLSAHYYMHLLLNAVLTIKRFHYTASLSQTEKRKMDKLVVSS